MPHEILFILLDEMQNAKKMKTREVKERKFEKEVRAILPSNDRRKQVTKS